MPGEDAKGNTKWVGLLGLAIRWCSAVLIFAFVCGTYVSATKETALKVTSLETKVDDNAKKAEGTYARSDTLDLRLEAITKCMERIEENIKDLNRERVKAE